MKLATLFALIIVLLLTSRNTQAQTPTPAPNVPFVETSLKTTGKIAFLFEREIPNQVLRDVYILNLVDATLEQVYGSLMKQNMGVMGMRNLQFYTTGIAMSPNGRYLVIDNSGLLDLKDLTSEHYPTSLTAGHGPLWSPDNQRIAFVRGSLGTYVINRDRTGDKLVFPMSSPVAWYPDSKYLAVIQQNEADASKLYRVGIESGEVSPLSVEFRPGDTLQILSGGTQLAINRGGNVYLAKPDGTDAQLVAWIGSPEYVWTADQKYLIYVYGGEIYALELANPTQPIKLVSGHTTIALTGSD